MHANTSNPKALLSLPYTEKQTIITILGTCQNIHSIIPTSTPTPLIKNLESILEKSRQQVLTDISLYHDPKNNIIYMHYTV